MSGSSNSILHKDNFFKNILTKNNMTLRSDIT